MDIKRSADKKHRTSTSSFDALTEIPSNQFKRSKNKIISAQKKSVVSKTKTSETKRPGSKKTLSTSSSQQKIRTVQQPQKVEDKEPQPILKQRMPSPEASKDDTVELLQQEFDECMGKITDLDELILNNDFQDSLYKQTQAQKSEMQNTMTLGEIKSVKQVHFADGGRNNRQVQCDLLSMKKFRRLNEILAEKDLIIQHLQDQENQNNHNLDPDQLQENQKSRDIIKDLKKQLEQTKVENMKLEKCYQREKKIVESKVTELEEFQAQMYEDTYSEKQELMQSKSTNVDLESDLNEYKKRGRQDAKIIAQLKTQMTQQMHALQAKFDDIEYKHQQQVTQIKGDLERLKHLRSLLPEGVDPVKHYQQLASENEKMHIQINNLQNAVNVLQQEKQIIYNQVIEMQQYQSQQKSLLDSQSQCQYEYLQEEIKSLREAKAEEISLKEIFKNQAQEMQIAVSDMADNSKIVVEEIINNIKSSLENAANNAWSEENQRSLSQIQDEFHQLNLITKKDAILASQLSDPNQSDLILNYQFSNENDEDAQDQNSLSYVKDVFHLLPTVLQLFTFTGEATEALFQKIEFDDGQISQCRSRCAEQVQQMDKLNMELEQARQQQTVQELALNQIRNAKDDIIKQTNDFATKMKQMKDKNEQLDFENKQYKQQLQMLSEQFDKLENRIMEETQSNFQNKLQTEMNKLITQNKRDKDDIMKEKEQDLERIREEAFNEAMEECDLESQRLKEINDKIRKELRDKQKELSQLQYQFKDLQKSIHKMS